MKKKKGFSLNFLLLMLGLLPMLLTVIVSVAFSIFEMRANVVEQMENRLKVACISLEDYFGMDWEEWMDNGIADTDEEYIDILQSEGIEMTVFKEDTRYLSSLRNSDGSRVSGTKASDEVINTVYKNGKDYTAQNVVINGAKYIVYYMPLENENNEVVGMAFAGEKMTAVDKAINALTSKLILLAIIITAICVALILLVARKVRKPLVEVTNGVKQLASGDLNVEITSSTNIIETAELIAGTETLSQELKKLVSGIKSEVSALTGNSTDLLDTVTKSSEAVNQVSAAINDVAQGNTDLAGSVSDQMASVEELGANIDEVNNEVITMQELTSQVVDVSRQASATMDELIAINNQTRTNIDAIAEQANKNLQAAERISNIIVAIEDITTETNLLSLNASIEAARAGEAGKGFAVVAGSISHLAAQSANETQNIQNIVAELLAEISKTGTISDELVSSANQQIEKLDNTRNAFASVIRQINDIGTNTRTVYDNMNSITNVKNSVSDITESLSAVSEQTSASAQEVSASALLVNDNMSGLNQMSNNLNESAKKLAELVAFFH